MSNELKKIAIIGANEYQCPLIRSAKSRGLETHVFAWQVGAEGERVADFFHPISITEIDEIVDQCRRIGIQGVASIGSDLANITVSAVAEAMGLTANSTECIRRSTDKYLMREAFWEHGDPSPKCLLVESGKQAVAKNLDFPVIVKPVDRSGSRGIAKVEDASSLGNAVETAIGLSFSKRALLEEFVEGREFSVEYISWEGVHLFVALTEKFTTGAPHFIEKGHLQPARIDDSSVIMIKQVVEHALDSLGVTYGASHSEVKLTQDGKPYIIEIGSRMGGDFIGSSLVELSTGYDFVGAALDVALGSKPIAPPSGWNNYAGVRFVFDKNDRDILCAMETDRGIEIVSKHLLADGTGDVTDSSSRHGYCIFKSKSADSIEAYLP